MKRLCVLCLTGMLLLSGCGDVDATKSTNNSNDTNNTTNAISSIISDKYDKDLTEVSLTNGNYVAGKDFKAGMYNIVAIEGGGNVSSSNMYDGGLNAIMGSKQKIKESKDIGMNIYQEEYKNIDLPKKTTLKVDGVKIKLIPVK